MDKLPPWRFSTEEMARNELLRPLRLKPDERSAEFARMQEKIAVRVKTSMALPPAETDSMLCFDTPLEG